MKKSIKTILAFFMAIAISVCYIPDVSFADDIVPLDEGDVTWYMNDDGVYDSFEYEGQMYGEDNITSVKEDSTCSKEGKITYTAYVPDKTSEANIVGTVEVPVEKKPHTDDGVGVDKVITEPTCTTNGVMGHWKKCSVCEQEYGDPTETPIPAKHQFEYKMENVIEPTCQDWGSYEEVYNCKVCGHDFDSTVDDPELYPGCSDRKTRYTEPDPRNHVWDEGVVTKEPTCKHKGETTYTCTLCGTKKTRKDIDKLDHSYVLRVKLVKEPTCTEEGEYQGAMVCENCGAVEPDSELDIEPIPALGHEWDDGVITKEPTEGSCVEDGEITYTCKRCGEKDIEYFGDGEHNLVTRVLRFPADCMHDGRSVKVTLCSICGKVVDRETTINEKADGQHKWELDEDEDWIVAPTCTEEGKADPTDVYCEVCDASYASVNPDEDYYIAPALGHNPKDPVAEVVTPSTCEEGGTFDFVSYCDRCDEELFRIPGIPTAPLGHKWDPVGHKDPTCTEAGWEKFKCTRIGCDAEKTEVIEATGHVYLDEPDPIFDPEGKYFIEQPATCVKDGKIIKRCIVCGSNDSVVEETIQALGIDAPGHEFDPDDPDCVKRVRTKEPTCTELGAETVSLYCKAGDLLFTTVVPVPMTEHRWVVDPDKPQVDPQPCQEGHPDSGVDGIKYYKCANEGCTATKEEPISCHGEYWTKRDISYAATCEKDGKNYYQCTNCGAVDEEVLPKKGHDYEMKGRQVHWGTSPSKGKIEYQYECLHDRSGECTCETPTKSEFVDFEYSGVNPVYDPELIGPADDEDPEFPMVYRIPVDSTGSPLGVNPCEATHFKYWVVDYTYPDFPVSETSPITVEPAAGHVFEEPVKRNIKEATCTEGGHYDLVPKCVVCGKEFPDQKQTVTTEPLGHDLDMDDIIYECVDDNPYDNPTTAKAWCKRCHEYVEIGTVMPTGHEIGETVLEYATPENGGPTCTEPGIAYVVTYCGCEDEYGNPAHSFYGMMPSYAELNREEIVVGAYGHKPGDIDDIKIAGIWIDNAIVCTRAECGEVIDIAVPGEEGFDPADAAAVAEAKAKLIEAANAALAAIEAGETPDTVALRKANEDFENAVYIAQVNAYRNDDIKIWFQPTASKTVKYNGKAVKLTSSDVVVDNDSTGNITFTYFKDAKCTKALKGAPKNVGTYYVMATIGDDGYYAGKSTSTAAPAKIKITKAAVKVTPAKKTYKANKKTGKLKKTKKFKITTKGLNKKIKATYKKSNKAGKAKIKVSKAGKVTVKAGLKKGTYKVKVKATPKSKNFKAKTVTIKVIIK